MKKSKITNLYGLCLKNLTVQLLTFTEFIFIIFFFIEQLFLKHQMNGNKKLNNQNAQINKLYKMVIFMFYRKHYKKLIVLNLFLKHL